MGAWENIVQGTVTPDEYFVFKPTLKSGMKATVSKNLGSKNKTMVYADKENGQTGFTVNIDTSIQKQEQYVLNDAEIRLLAN